MTTGVTQNDEGMLILKRVQNDGENVILRPKAEESRDVLNWILRFAQNDDGVRVQDDDGMGRCP